MPPYFHDRVSEWKKINLRNYNFIIKGSQHCVYCWLLLSVHSFIDFFTIYICWLAYNVWGCQKHTFSSPLSLKILPRKRFQLIFSKYLLKLPANCVTFTSSSNCRANTLGKIRFMRGKKKNFSLNFSILNLSFHHFFTRLANTWLIISKCMRLTTYLCSDLT